MKKLIKYIILLSIIFLILQIITCVIIGSGFIISKVFPLTLFQSSVLCLCTTMGIGIIFSIGMIFDRLGILIDILCERGLDFIDDEDDEFEDDEFEDDEFEDDEFEDDEFEDDGFDKHEYSKKKTTNAAKRSLNIVHTDKTGRNELCPCGSGKKYKKCCGR